MRRLLAAAAVLAALAAGCGGGDERDAGKRPPERLTIATGGRGGIYFVYGATLARTISKHLAGYRATAQESTGSVENLLRLRDGRADIALTLGDTALDAVEGREAFDKPVPVRALAQIYRSYVQVVTLRGSPVRTLRDLKGKRVSIGSPDSGTEVVAERALAVAHLSPRRDIRAEHLGVAESAKALEDGSIDAFFWSGGLPTGAITELARGQEIALLDLAALARPLRQRYGGVYGDASIPAGTYPGVPAAVPTVSIPNYVVVSARMNGGLAYDLTHLLLERGRIDAAHAQDVIAPVPLHPGAEQYYEQAGR